MKLFNWISTFLRKAPIVGGAAFGSLGSARWSTKDYANFAKESYIINYVSYRCIDLIAQGTASVPWKIFKKVDEGREVLSEHPLMRVLHRTNPTTGFAAHQYAATSFLGIAGNTYIEKLAPDTGPNKGVPFELKVQRPDHIKFILDNDTKELIGYALEIDGKVLKEWSIDFKTGQSDLLHIKKFHPLNDIEGLSPVEPAAKSIDTSNEALTWNKKLLQNDARPGLLIISDNVLGDDQYNRLKKQFREKYSGGENAGESLIVDGGIKDIRPLTLTPKDMDFLKGNWDLVRQICMTFGVPPQVLGVPGDSTFANFEQARLFLWETTIFFYLMLFRDEYNNWFFPEDDKIFIDYILDDIPALAPRRKEKWEMVTKSDFLTINEKREEMGKEEIDGGNVLLIPANMIPLDMIGVTEEEVDNSESDMEDINVDIEDEEEEEAEMDLNLKAV